jgi:thioredoxin domain-containing protein 5
LSHRCGHCRKLAPHWVNLATQMQNKLNIAEVNCEDYDSICRHEGVTGYPMLFYYSDGAKTEYTGGRKLELMKDFAERASSPCVPFYHCFILWSLTKLSRGTQELQASELHQHVVNNPVTYLLLHPLSNTRIFVRLMPFGFSYLFTNSSRTK